MVQTTSKCSIINMKIINSTWYIVSKRLNWMYFMGFFNISYNLIWVYLFIINHTLTMKTLEF